MIFISDNKPNHVCKYSKCTLGQDGGRKKYYACNDCDRVHNWKAIGCCFEHAMAYQDEVKIARQRSGAFSLEDKKEMWKADRIDEVKPNSDNAEIVENLSKTSIPIAISQSEEILTQDDSNNKSDDTKTFDFKTSDIPKENLDVKSPDINNGVIKTEHQFSRKNRKRMDL